jgi:integral membrane sensor domain MASE1
VNWSKTLVTRESLRLLARAALTSLAYFISARMGVALLFQPQSIASFWPPSGLLVGVLARSKQRTWPIILLVVIPTNIMANLLAGKPLAISSAFALINGVANAIGAWLLVHFIGRCARLTQMKEVVGLIALPGIIGSALSATLAAIVVTQGMGISSFWSVWYAWWAADALGILLIGPVILTWSADRTRAFKTVRPQRLAEITLLFVAMMLVAVFLFGKEPLTTSMLLPLPYLTFPFLLWAAVRFGPQTTSAASLLLALVAVWHTAQGHGPFAITGESVGDHVFSAQVFLSVSIITSLLLAATLAERRRAQEARRTSTAAEPALA